VLHKNRVLLFFVVVLLAFSGSSSVLAKGSPEHCVEQAIPGGGSIFKGCFFTRAEALASATNGGIQVSSSADLQTVDRAIKDYNARNLSSQSLTPSGGIRPQTTYVIGIFYDWTNWQSSSITFTTTVSTGCQSASYGNNFSATWNDRTESAIGYINCNYTIPYEHIGFTGSLNPCASPCSSFGALNNAGSSWRLTKTWPG